MEGTDGGPKDAPSRGIMPLMQSSGDAPPRMGVPPLMGNTAQQLQDEGLSDDERVRLGAQQAAMIQLQAVSDRELREKAMHQQRLLEEDTQRKLMEAQQQAIVMQAQQQQQQVAIAAAAAAAEQQQLQQMQMAAAAETHKEEELKRLQMMALAEKEKEHLKHVPPSGPVSQPIQAPPAPVQQQRPQGMPPHPATSAPGVAPPPLMSGLSQPLATSQAPPLQPGPPPAPVAPAPSRQPPPPPVSQPPPHAMPGPPPPVMSGPPPPPQFQPATNQPPPVPPPGFSQSAPPPSSQSEPPPPGVVLGPLPPRGQMDKPRPLMSIDTQPTPNLQRKEEDGEDDDEQTEFKLPQALEKVLAFKDVRAQQVGVRPEDMEQVEKGEVYQEPVVVFHHPRPDWPPDVEDDEDDEEEPSAPVPNKESKNKKRKTKKKRAKERRRQQKEMEAEKKMQEPVKEEEDDKVEIVYVQETPDLNATDPGAREFHRIFETFKIVDVEKERARVEEEERVRAEMEQANRPSMKVKNVLSDEEMEEEEEEIKGEEDPDAPKLSKKKLKKLNRLSVAELKQLVARPDVVEMHDVTARDPKLLVSLKGTRNSVTVPRHWCFKRKYLQGKRGIEKAPFELPAFIRDTGIEEMRAALQEKEDQKTLKSRMRERVRPKMGKIDIDYQKLHDAFFRYQTKPKMTIHGDLYYEGKEFETRLKEKKPGNLSDELRTALGMPLGANAEKYPPPWLIAMQRYGPPPSYPNLKIPGLNSPIPEGCSFGYHAGGWGKPPVDEAGKPLYGDVFGTQTAEVLEPVEEEDVDKTLWGALESESEEEASDSDEGEMEGEGEEEPDATGLVTPGDPGLVTPSGVTSVPVGVETPDMIELRKKRIEDAMDQGGETPALYTVLPEKKTTVAATQMMGSAHVYDVAGALAGTAAAAAAPAARRGDEIELALNPDELDLDQAAIQAKYDQQMREQQSHLEKEDLSDMVAEHAAKQKKRKKQQQDQGKASKKYKDFKF